MAVSVDASPAGTTASLLQEILQGSGLSQADLARRAGLPRSVLNVYLHGRREPGADALLRIASAGGFDLKPTPRRPPVDPEGAGKILVQVLELAEALPFRPRAEMQFPPLASRLAEAAR
jgi:transcriptional regulator with XRE-family HTH domain